jgi:hypothetical protein
MSGGKYRTIKLFAGSTIFCAGRHPFGKCLATLLFVESVLSLDTIMKV